MAQFEFVDLEGLGVFKQENDKIYASSLTISQNAQNGVVTFNLYSKDGTLINTKTLDLDTEHIIKSVSLNYAQKKLVFTRDDDTTLECDISTLIDTLNGNIDDVEANKVDKTTTINGHALNDNVTITKGDVGLENVDNTSDSQKNSAIATLENKTIDGGTF